MPDHGAPPLWTGRGPVSPLELGLSADLSAAITAWEYECDHEGPNADRWPNDVAYDAEGRRLAAPATEELGRPVIYDG
jgi:hypothetical protein